MSACISARLYPSLFAEFLVWKSLQPYSWLVRFMHVQLTQWNLYYRKIEGKTCFQPPQHPLSKYGWLLTCCTFFLHFFHWANVCTPVLTSCFEQKGCVGTLKPFRWSEIYNSQPPMRERICCVCLSVFEPTAVQTKCQPWDWQLWQEGNVQPPLHAPVCVSAPEKECICVWQLKCYSTGVCCSQH